MPGRRQKNLRRPPTRQKGRIERQNGRIERQKGGMLPPSGDFTVFRLAADTNPGGRGCSAGVQVGAGMGSGVLT